VVLEKVKNMVKLGELIQEADWKTEKHVPIIECPDTINVNEIFKVKIGIGREVAHPNTTEHHIRWISLYFHPKDEKFPYHIGHYEFNAHGESAKDSNTSTIYTHHEVTTSLKTGQPGTILALSLCNIHGLWQSIKEIKIK
jgi:superoxide reductase